MRLTLLRACLAGATPGVLAAAMLGLSPRPQWGWDVLAGTVVVALPQLWFVIRATRAAAMQTAAALAMGKLSLVALGYATWFALNPEAGLPATLGGTALTLMLMTLYLYWAQRR